MPDPKTGRYSVPPAVQRAARMGLELREKFGRGGTSVGARRARQLASGEQLDVEDLVDMRGYFARHAVDQDAKGSESGGRWGDEDNPSAGYVAWLLWGGDDGREWVTKELARLDSGRRVTQIRLDADLEGMALRSQLAKPYQEPSGAWIIEGIAASEGTKRYPWGVEFMPYETLEAAAGRFAGLLLTDEHYQGIVDQKTPKGGPGIVLSADPLPDHRALRVRMRFDSFPRKAALSVGWEPVAVKPAKGTYNGVEYELIQVEATPNHVAVTNTPRDSSAQSRLDNAPEKKMAHINIGGLTAEVSDAFASKYDADLTAKAQRLDSLEAQVLEAKKEAETLRGENAALKAAAESAPRLDADEVKRLARERAQLIADARPRLRREDVERLDSLDDVEIKRAVVAAAGVKADDMSEGELAGAFRVVMASKAPTKRNDALGELDGRLAGGQRARRRQDGTVTPLGYGRAVGMRWLEDDKAK
jgi:hypothetical protein